jgi:hypothetical protein
VAPTPLGAKAARGADGSLTVSGQPTGSACDDVRGGQSRAPDAGGTRLMSAYAPSASAVQPQDSRGASEQRLIRDPGRVGSRTGLVAPLRRQVRSVTVLPVAILPRQFIVLTVVTVTALALVPDASARKLFRSPDHRVTCSIARYGTAPPQALCTSRYTLRHRPEYPPKERELCGSNASGAEIRPRGRTRLIEMCNALWFPGSGSPPRTLRANERITTTYFKCGALSRKTIRCASKRTGHGYKLSRTTFKRF